MKVPVEILPWQDQSWNMFASYIKQHRIPQALLICGQQGLGKLQLARQMAQSLVCDSPLENGFFCGHCQGCVLFIAETHPDVLLLEPEAQAKNININQIRKLISTLQLKPQFNAYRVVLMNPAERMNASAANGFLKCLEEPAEKTVLILISDQPSSLPATIISRCQKMNISVPDRQFSINWLHQQKISDDPEILLSLSSGSPLTAIKYANEQLIALRNHCFEQCLQISRQQVEPVAIAEEWQKHTNDKIYEWFTSWVMDIIKCHFLSDNRHLYNPDLKQPLQELAQKLDLIRLIEFYEKLLQSRNYQVNNLNKQLFIEDVLIHWSKLNTNSYHYG